FLLLCNCGTPSERRSRANAACFINGELLQPPRMQVERLLAFPPRASLDADGAVSIAAQAGEAFRSRESIFQQARTSTSSATGGPVDGIVAGEQVGPGDEQPASGKDDCDGATLPGSATKPQNQHREAEHDRQDMPRPDREIVELEQAVIGARRKQQEVGQRISPPFRHQSFSTWAIMRARMASPGNSPVAAAMFSRT